MEIQEAVLMATPIPITEAVVDLDSGQVYPQTHTASLSMSPLLITGAATGGALGYLFGSRK